MPDPVINTIAQMRAWERATWAAGQTEAEIIRRVGKRIARRARKLTRAGDMILILAGKGHNGNDARAAQNYLDGRKIKLLEMLTRRQMTCQDSKLRCAQKPALIIDGIFGIGLNRVLDEAGKKSSTPSTNRQIPMLAVDVPSGLNAETGENFGAAIEAAVTLTVGAPKIGMLAQSAWPFVGRLEIADDVGFVSCPHETELNWTLPEDFENFPPPRAGCRVTKVRSVIGDYCRQFRISRRGGFDRARRATRAARTRHAVHAAKSLSRRRRTIAIRDGQRLEAGNENFRRNACAILIGPGLAAPENCRTN